jgi:hypothetical protein
MDLFRGYIPGLCSGLSIRIDDLGKPLDPSAYPLITTLMAGGVKGLFELARSGFGYTPSRETFAGKCDLCNDIRTFLARNGWERSDELSPVEYYGDTP